MRLPVLLPLIGTLFLSACSTREEMRDETGTEPRTQSRQVSLSRYESTFNPADYDEEIEEAKKPHNQNGRRGGNETERDSVVVEWEFVQGFRIQLFATASIDEANAMRLTAAQKLPEDSVYVVFDPPVYKVRLGDFQTRMDANQKLSSLIEQGFPDAWVVNDRVALRKEIRIQQPQPDRRER